MNSLTEMAQSLERIEALLHTSTLPMDATFKQAAKLLDCSERSVRRYVDEGKLKLNRRGRITAASMRLLVS